MSSLNKVMLIGNLGKDPEMRYLPNGDAVANMTIATSETWKDKSSGDKKEATEWHRVVFFGRTAEVCGEYLKKGAKVFIEGKLQTRKWQDKDGQDRYTTEIRGDSMRMLDRKGDSDDQDRPRAAAPASGDDYRRGKEGRAPAPAPARAATSTGFEDMDDDIPF